ncbi:hypothetical protein NXV03_12650 [Phocaeicola vulgatus]|nr:hypothetical protein [Phocaeicola vulgatus]
MKGEQMGKKMLKPEKEDRKKGKCILNNFINEVKKIYSGNFLYRIAVFISKMINYKL